MLPKCNLDKRGLEVDERNNLQDTKIPKRPCVFMEGDLGIFIFGFGLSVGFDDSRTLTFQLFYSFGVLLCEVSDFF